MSLRLSLCALIPLASLGCSSPVPQAVQGAFSTAFAEGVSHGGACGSGNVSCTVGPHNRNIGYDLTPDDLETTNLVKDTQAGAQLDCSVTADGSGFTAAGIMIQDSISIEFHIAHIDASATQKNPAPGGVVYSDDVTAGTFSSPPKPACNFYLSTDQERSNLAPGVIWVSFDCPEMDNCGSQKACSLNAATIAMQNCGQ